MKPLILAAFVAFLSSSAQAADIEPDKIEFPWINGGAKTTYRMRDYPNAVFVLEAFQYS